MGSPCGSPSLFWSLYCRSVNFAYLPTKKKKKKFEDIKILKASRMTVSLNFIHSPYIYWVLLCTLDPVLRAMESQRITDGFCPQGLGPQGLRQIKKPMLHYHWKILQNLHREGEHRKGRLSVHSWCMKVLSAPMSVAGAAGRLFGRAETWRTGGERLRKRTSQAAYAKAGWYAKATSRCLQDEAGIIKDWLLPVCFTVLWHVFHYLVVQNHHRIAIMSQ